jgi:hypothetical protein
MLDKEKGRLQPIWPSNLEAERGLIPNLTKAEPSEVVW